jgi:type IV secretory pathway VirB6-like protein
MVISRQMVILFTSAALGIGAVTPTLAQNDASGVSGAATAGMGASSAKPTKAQRKEARKEARAKKNAELKKLEAAGYQPGRANDQNYPQDIQNAEKKAGAGQGASQ